MTQRSPRSEPSHPADETLAAAASGQLDRPHQLVLEAHLARCTPCSARLGELAAPGGAWLAQLPPEPLSAQCWEGIAAALLEPPAEDALDPSLPLPASVRQELAGTPRPIWWSRWLNGGRVAVLLEDPTTKAQLCVGEMPGGRRFPRHRHLGFEQVTVLAGGYEDERGSFEDGDYAEYAPDSEHGPDTLDGEPCCLLFRLDGKVRFSGWRGFLQRLFP